MKKDEVWEKIKNDKDAVYGGSMLDMFLKTTERLERKHWEELSQAQRRLVSPEVKFSLASTVEEAERAVKEGAKNFNEAFRNAAEGGHLEVCEWLAGKGARNFDGALYGAAEEGHLEVCKFLVEKGARDFDGALSYAAYGSHLDICKWLVGKGARHFDGALYFAAERGHLEICKWAVEKGARDFHRALSYAGSPEIKKFLLKTKEEHEER